MSSVTSRGQPGIKKDKSAIHLNYLIVEDTGYTVICPWCAQMLDFKKEMIGKERPIETRFCGACKKDSDNKKSRYYY